MKAMIPALPVAVIVLAAFIAMTPPAAAVAGAAADGGPGATEAGPPSRLEAMYGARAGMPLWQFGHRLFDRPGPAAAGPVGAVPPDYVLGSGDRLTVTFRGQRNDSLTVAVDRDGRILLPELRPVGAAGRTLAEVRAELEAEAAATLTATDIYVSLAEVRQIGVLVAGEVARPGRLELTVFATVLDALYAAGGITRQGSLRAVRLVRAGTATTIDLYALLQGGPSDADLPLRDGDRIVVPPLGATLAVAGAVRRPAVYELPPDDPGITADAAVALAGGPLVPGPVRRLRLAIGPDGEEHTGQVGPQAALGDGDVLLVTPLAAARAGAVTLAGHVEVPGAYALDEAATLGRLLGDGSRLRPDPYLPFAVLETDDPATRARVLQPVDLQAVLAGRADRRLHDGDTVIVLGGADVRFLTSAPVLALLRGEALPADDLERCAGLAALARALSGAAGRALAAGPIAEAAHRLAPERTACPTSFDAYPDVLPLALHHGVLLWRGVPRPGVYPAASQAALGDLLRLAGRTDLPAPPRRAGPGDVVAVPEPGVTLAGHVWLPGPRPLAAAPSLAVLFDRGEALRPDAYPLIGVIARRDPVSLGRRFVAFSPQAVLTGAGDLRLGDDDRVLVFDPAEARRLAAAGSAAGTAAAGDGETGPWLDAAYGPGRGGPGAGPGGDDVALARFLADHAVVLGGAVARPGPYPVAGDTALAHLLDAAGGLSREADLTNAEITTVDRTPGGDALQAGRTLVNLTVYPPATVVVRPGDAVRVHPLVDPVTPRGVTIRGEVRRPGAYDLVAGERLSQLIARAGGLTPQAYSDGAVFTRVAERERQRARFRQTAAELDRRLAGALTEPERPGQAEIDLAQDLADQLRAVEPTGRVVVEADPDMLRANPALDVVLQPGDTLYIPPREQSVTVTGEVLAPATLQFRSGKTVRDYVREAGGYTHDADRDRIYVVYPDGSAQPIAPSLWRFEAVHIPPGSTVVVPRDPAPFDFLAFSGNVATILGQIAVTAASLAVLSD